MSARDSDASISDARRRYWRFNLRLIAVLLTIGGATMFGAPLWARQLYERRLAGWRLPFYLGAQGAILVDLLLVLVYVVLMRGADRRLARALAADAVGRS